MLQRIVMGAATALVFSPMLGWRFSAIWLVLYTLIQFLEAEVFRPVVSGEVTEPTGWRGLFKRAGNRPKPEPGAISLDPASDG